MYNSDIALHMRCSLLFIIKVEICQELELLVKRSHHAKILPTEYVISQKYF